MGEMTLERVREWLVGKERMYVGYQRWATSLNEQEVRAFRAAIDAHLATPAQTVDVEYEIWQENMCVADACGEREDVRREILRYLSQYAQDSECKILEVTRVNVTDKIFQAIGDKT